MLTSESIIRSIPKYFNPVKARNRELTVAYQLSRTNGSIANWTIRVSGGRCQVFHGIQEPFTTKLIMQEEDYLRLVYGKMDYENGRWRGRFRLVGNTLGHRELNYYLDLPKSEELFFL